MITTVQIEEWIREIEQRPDSAKAIIYQIADRLRELQERNRLLLAENIALQDGEKVQEYEQRIANLEYQLDLLKRQVVETVDAESEPEQQNLLIYNAKGRVLKLSLAPEDLPSTETMTFFDQGALTGDDPPQMLVVEPQEELLFVFDSGRVVNLPVADIETTRLSDGIGLNWETAFLQSPRGGETLTAILPITKMALNNYCVQVSRRGYVKKIRESFLESCIARSNVGSGVVLPSDKTFKLVLCDEDSVLLLISKEGQLLSVPVSQLPHTIGEISRLSMSDHIVSTFKLGTKSSFIAVTQNGKIFYRQRSWLEPDLESETLKRSILSKARREAGTRIVTSSVADETDWGVLLASDGRLVIFKVSELIAQGAILRSDEQVEILGFTTFTNRG